MKKVITLMLALALVLSTVCILGACNKDTKPNDESKNTTAGTTGEPTTRKIGDPLDELSVCLASEPASLDPALNSAVDGATMILHAFAGLVSYKPDEFGALKLTANCAKELPEGVVGEDGKVTYTFELKDGLKWSDGSALTADDFVYAWNRAVAKSTTADYAYMFDIIDGYDEAVEETGKLNVTADGNKLTIVINNACPYFYELLAFPTYMPVKKSVVEASPDKWATDPATYIGNGPYIMKSWDHNSLIVYEKNPNYYDAASVSTKKIDFYLSDNSNNMLANFKNGSWMFIDDVPTEEINNLKADPQFVIAGQLGTYYVIFNVNENILPADSTLTGVEKEKAEAEIRFAMGLLFDRKHICEDIAQGGQVSASSFVSMGLTEADGVTEFYKNAGNFAANGYYGYFDAADTAYEANYAKALEILKKYYAFDETSKKFTNVPTLAYIYNTNEGHKAIAEYLQSALATVGINMTLTNEEWNSFLETRKKGQYTVARNGWVADYNDPISYLDMWITASGNNDAQFGKGAHKDLAMYSIDLSPYGGEKVVNGTWAQTYDACISLVKAATDPAKRYELMHLAEDLLMSTGAIVPIYYYTDLYMCSDAISNVFVSPLGYKYFMYATTK